MLALVREPSPALFGSVKIHTHVRMQPPVEQPLSKFKTPCTLLQGLKLFSGIFLHHFHGVVQVVFVGVVDPGRSPMVMNQYHFNRPKVLAKVVNCSIH